MPHKRHSVSLNGSAFRALRNFRRRLPATKRTYSRAVLLAARPSRVGFDLTAKQLRKVRVWFTPEQLVGVDDERLRSLRCSAADLIKMAAECKGTAVDDFLTACAIDAARSALLGHYKARAGVVNPNQQRMEDAERRIADAYKKLVGAGLPVTVKRLRNSSGSRRLAVVRWLEKHHPELL